MGITDAVWHQLHHPIEPHEEVDDANVRRSLSTLPSATKLQDLARHTQKAGHVSLMQAIKDIDIPQVRKLAEDVRRFTREEEVKVELPQLRSTHDNESPEYAHAHRVVYQDAEDWFEAQKSPPTFERAIAWAVGSVRGGAFFGDLQELAERAECSPDEIRAFRCGWAADGLESGRLPRADEAPAKPEQDKSAAYATLGTFHSALWRTNAESDSRAITDEAIQALTSALGLLPAPLLDALRGAERCWLKANNVLDRSGAGTAYDWRNRAHQLILDAEILVDQILDGGEAG